MRVVVTGASGNVGAGVLRALREQMPDAEVVGICRRPPTTGRKYERVKWYAVDLSSSTAAVELAPAMRGADVVIHLALAIQPVRDTDYLYRANVVGTQVLLSAMEAAGIRHLVYASSLGIYAPGAREPVTESWPDSGQPTSVYSRHKVMAERILDRFEQEHPQTVVARFRPTVVVQREAAWLIHSLYLGPLVPRAALELLRRGALRILPLPRGLALQFVHADDVGDAVIRMMQRRSHGSFNIAADVLDTRALAAVVGARAIGVDPRLMRAVITALSACRVIALTPGWYDVATNSPVMDTTKARRELGWAPSRTSAASALELLEGMAEGAAGTSAAMGWRSEERRMTPQTIWRIHDGSLLLWTTLAVARALGVGPAIVPQAAAVAVNLAAGTPMALDRVLERRRDPVAILAPLAVVAALMTTVRGGWASVAATTCLGVLGASERRRARRIGQT